ncbi:MAG TPA: peptidase S10 [Mizugakiibacter sp.]
MRNHVLTTLLLASLIAFGVPAHAADKPAGADKPAAEKSEAKPIPEERAVHTQHSVDVDGKRIAYTATAGTLLIRDDDAKPIASVFYVAYTADGTKDAGKRPVTFLYNGGPGSSSVWLHMGSVGPMRITTASPDATAPAPYALVPNRYSLLDKTDLVFIDAVGTGFSRPVGKAEDKDFWGVDQDLDAFAKAIIRYVDMNKRWNSPKFLFGESYGTTRSAGLVNTLQQRGMAINGVVLVSSILNYGARFPGLDQVYIGYLPSYAAIAWYHDKLANKPAELGPFLDEVRAFARGEYAAALARGQDLPKAEEDAIAQKLSRYTGLSVQYLEEADLRVDPARFRKELLRDQRRTLGRYDARFEGIDLDAAGEHPDYDASDTGIAGAFVAAFHDYLAGELKYTSDLDYRPTYYKIIRAWDWHHKLPGQQRPLLMAYTAGDLARAMRENPHLKVFSANGYFDLATPFFATEYDLGHMQLDPSLRGNLSFGYYPSGHMIYLNVDALKQLKGDLAGFYDRATAH